MNRGGRINSYVVEGTRFPLTGSKYRAMRRNARGLESPYKHRGSQTRRKLSVVRFKNFLARLGTARELGAAMTPTIKPPLPGRGQEGVAASLDPHKPCDGAAGHALAYEDRTRYLERCERQIRQLRALDYAAYFDKTDPADELPRRIDELSKRLEALRRVV